MKNRQLAALSVALASPYIAMNMVSKAMYFKLEDISIKAQKAIKNIKEDLA